MNLIQNLLAYIAINNKEDEIIMNTVELAKIISLGESSSLYAEEMPIKGSSIEDIDLEQFNLFLYGKYQKYLDEFKKDNVSLEQLLTNLNLAIDGKFLLSGFWKKYEENSGKRWI